MPTRVLVRRLLTTVENTTGSERWAAGERRELCSWDLPRWIQKNTI
jgi:hypothetical protein